MIKILHKRGLKKNINNLTLEEGEIALAYNDDKTKVELYAGDGKGNVLLINSDVSEEINEILLQSEQYTDSQINALVNGAPEAMDTLKELADAIAENSNIMDALNSAIGNKVDKIDGKGLSANDYTTAEKNKLAGIAENAEKNSINGIMLNGTDIAVNSMRKVNIPVPTSVSELTNDAGYITSTDIDTSQNHIHANKAVLDTITPDTLDSKADKTETQTALNNKFGFIKSLTADDDLNELGWSTGWFRIVLTVPADKNYPCNSGNMFIGTLEAYDVEDGKIQVLKSVLHNKIWYRTMQRLWTEPMQEVWKDWKEVISTNDYTTRDKDVVNNICWKNKSFNKSGWYRIAQMPKAASDSVSAIVQIGKSWGNIWHDGIMFAITTINELEPNITQLTRGARSGDYIFPKCRLLVKGINEPEYLEIYVNNFGNNNWENFDYNIYGMSGYIQTIDDATLTESIPDGYTSYEFTFSNSGIKTDTVRAESLYGTVVNSSGADGAELMEWADGNPDNEDRCGYFVTFAGHKIRIANSSDDLRKVSAISGNYSFLGNDYADSWHSKYKKDVYGRRITKNVVHPAVTDDKGNVISEEYTTKEYILNDDYDENMEYIPRSERPEWDAVICYGQVVVRDDGTCIPDGFCKPNDEGKATYANDGFYVMDRVDEGNILIKI